MLRGNHVHRTQGNAGQHSHNVVGRMTASGNHRHRPFEGAIPNDGRQTVFLFVNTHRLNNDLGNNVNNLVMLTSV